MRKPDTLAASRIVARRWIRVAFVYIVLLMVSGCEAAYPDGKYVCGDDALCPHGLECRKSENLCYKNISKTGGSGDFGTAGGSNSNTNYPNPCDGKRLNQLVCDRRFLTQCDGNNGLIGSELCDSEAMCLAGIRGVGCGVCEPGSYACDGKTLQQCDQTGQHSPTLSKNFNTEKACNAELKRLGGACNLGQFKCVIDVVYKCNADQTGFEEDLNIDFCEIGFCNELLGKCNVCEPGSVICNEKGDGIVKCREDGQGETVSACGKSTPVCINGVCG